MMTLGDRKKLSPGVDPLLNIDIVLRWCINCPSSSIDPDFGLHENFELLNESGRFTDDDCAAL
jgi:hypothetical protein